jgi:hypothetical protein
MPNQDEKRIFDGFETLEGGMDAGNDSSLIKPKQGAFFRKRICPWWAGYNPASVHLSEIRRKFLKRGGSIHFHRGISGRYFLLCHR